MNFSKLLTISVMLILAMLLSSMTYVQITNASPATLNLPNKAVTLEAFNDTKAFFMTKLSNVPAGYAVTNKTYSGWCVDRTAEMRRSPATHQVLLYSSLNPPAALTNQSWDRVNYILNHKKGSALDIQNAIWYFINMNTTWTSFGSQTAWELVNDTMKNGQGFVPDSTQVTAVIAYPVRIFSTDTAVQISIIEVTAGSSNTPSGSSSDNSVTPALPGISLYVIAIVVVAIIVVSLAVLVRRRTKMKRA